MRIFAIQTATPANSAILRRRQAQSDDHEASSSPAAANRFDQDFSQIPVHSPSPIYIQPKLTVNTPGDTHEQEADRVAEEVMRMPESPQPGPGFGGETRSLYKAGPPGVAHERLQPRRVEESGAGGMAAPSSVHEVLSSSGRPLDLPTRAFMEPRFHRDFSDVRVHSGAAAGKSAHEVNAHAYTLGAHIVFGPGQFSPHSHQGRRLLAHELAHVAQGAGPESGAPRAAEQIRRTVVFDRAGLPVSYEFKIGVELTLPFAQKAKTMVAGGALSDSDIIKLKADAVRDRDTVSDAERVFIAGLLDRTNVRTLKATTLGAATTFSFPLASITDARVAHVIDVDRTAVPASVTKPLAEAAKSFQSFEYGKGVANTMKAESAATAEIASQAGSTFATQARALVAYLSTNAISASDTLQAMLAAASDQDPGDKISAGIVYAVAKQAGNVMVNDILNGKVKVDGMSPARFAAMGGITGEQAIYVGAAPINTTLASQKGDTVYLKTDTNIDNVQHRSVIIHELRHAQDDKAGSATGKATFPVRQDLELVAYKAQGLYVLDQMSTRPAREQVQMAKDATTPENDGILIGALIEGKANLTKYQPLLELLFAAVAPPARQNAAGVARLLAKSNAILEAALLQSHRAATGITSTTKTTVEGLAGESVIHWIKRL